MFLNKTKDMTNVFSRQQCDAVKAPETSMAEAATMVLQNIFSTLTKVFFVTFIVIMTIMIIFFLFIKITTIEMTIIRRPQ